MKVLTTEQLVDLLVWVRSSNAYRRTRSAMDAIEWLLRAECREHGFAGIEDAYRVLIEKEGK